MTRQADAPPVGYFSLLRSNDNYRRLFIGQVISQTGDWFNSVALFTLLLSLGASGEAIGFVLILKLIPTFFVGPLAGVVADRFNRKTIMIASDVLRGLIVLGFLLIRSPDLIWLAYVLTALQVVASTFFEPAKSAAIPGIVTRAQLISANALSSVAWSVTLALGSALGGVVTDAFGRDAAFIIDAVTFLVSAAFIAGVRIPSREREARTGRLTLSEVTGASDLIEGARFLNSNRHVIAALSVKSGWGLGGGVLLLLAVFGKEVFPIGRDGSTSIGLLYAARGVGALLGPLLARKVTGSSTRMMRRGITVAFFVSTAFYIGFAQAGVITLAILCVIGAHAGGSIQWVYSTTLLQLSVPDRFLGRVFAIELALVTLTMSVSTYLTGYGLDRAGWTARDLATVLGLVFLVPGLLWWTLQRWLDRAEVSSASPKTVGAPETSLPRQ